MADDDIIQIKDASLRFTSMPPVVSDLSAHVTPVLTNTTTSLTPTTTMMYSTMPSDLVTNITEWMQIVICIACGLSILGSLLIIITYILWSDIRTVSRSLLVYLSVADLLLAGGYLYGGIRNFEDTCWDCKTQSAITTFATTSSFLWTICIAVYLHITIVHVDTELARRSIKFFHLFSWGIPLVLVVTALSLGKLGYDSSDISVGWCWIDVHQPDYVLWMVLTVKGWEFITYIILPTLYLHINIHLRHQRHHLATITTPSINTANGDIGEGSTSDLLQQAIDAMLKVNRKLTLIPIIFLVLRVWGSIRFILFLANTTAVSNKGLVMLHGIGNCSQGAANSILFCLSTDNIRKKLVGTVSCCFRPNSREVSENQQQEELEEDERDPLV